MDSKSIATAPPPDYDKIDSVAHAMPTLPPTAIQQLVMSEFGQRCSSCQAPLQTRVGFRSTCSTHTAFCLCCLFLPVIGWICAPFIYCMDSCREPRVYCIACGNMVQ